MLEAFLRELAAMQEDYVRLQPTSKDGISSTTALMFITRWKGSVQSARHKASLHNCTLTVSMLTCKCVRMLAHACCFVDSCWAWPPMLCGLVCALHLTWPPVQQAAEIQSGMDIFSIPQPPYKELTQLEQELDLLSRMWGVVAEWESVYDGWKTGHFKQLKVSVLPDTRATTGFFATAVAVSKGAFVASCVYPIYKCLA